MKCSGQYDDGVGARTCDHTTADGCPDAPPCSMCGKRHSTRMLGSRGECRPSLADLVTVTIRIDPETQARMDAELEGHAFGRLFQYAERTYDALQEIVPGPMRSGLWDTYRPHFRVLPDFSWAWRSLA